MSAPEQASDAPSALDESQKAVIRLADGASAAVIGAPGSGKTTTLVELVAERIRERGYRPDEVLVIAPNRRAAQALRDRLALRVGVPTTGPMARTLNSVAFQLVSARASIGAAEAPRLLTGAEQDTIIAELLDGHLEDDRGPGWPDPLLPEVRQLRGFRTELRELMMRAVESGLRPSDLAALGRANDRAEWVAAAAFIDEYERVVDSFASRFLDSAELIAQATAELRSGGGLPTVRLVVVDDAQEQGPGGFALLRELAGRGVAVVAFGDPDVTSTTFRGSDPAALASLGPRIGVPVETIVLRTIYRHGPEIRALVQQLSRRVGSAGAFAHREAAVSPDTAVRARAPIEPAVLRIEATSRPAELLQIARVLREHHLFRNIPWSQMAVIVRSGSMLDTVARSLALSEVPSLKPAGGTNIRAEYASSQLVLAVAVALDRVELTAELATRLLTGPLCGLDPIAIRRLRLALRHEEIGASGNRSGDELLLEALSAAGRFATIDSAAARKAGRFAVSLSDARAAGESGASIEELFWLFWERSGLAELWGHQALGAGLTAEEANRHLDNVMALFTAAKRFVERLPGEPARKFIDDALASEVPEDSLTPQAMADAVWIGTPSAASGREFAIVVVAGLQDGVWPNPQLRGSLLYPQQLSQLVAGLPVADLDARAEVLSDELRMFELAVSRAGEQVVLSCTVNDDEQPSAFLRFPAIRDSELRSANRAEHPLTLRGLVGALRRRLTVAAASGELREDDAGAASALARLAAERVPGADPAEWYGLRDQSTTEPLVDLSRETSVVSVSPSKLETFEKSPLAWFIDTMAAAPSGLAAGIGTVVHAAMEQTGRIPADELNDDDLSVEALWKHIDEHWSELFFEAPWLAQRQRKTTLRLVEGLSEYLLDGRAAGNQLVSAEGAFEVLLGQVKLSGKIDRVERLPNGEIVIVDLKTGKTAPSQANVNDNAQLAGYQLALSEGVIDGASADADSGGAALLYVSGGVRGKLYRLLKQQPMDDETRARFGERVTAAGQGMAAADFLGVLNLDERDPKAGFMYRIHLVAGVSA